QRRSRRDAGARAQAANPSAAHPTVLLAVQNLEVAFRTQQGRRLVVDNVSFEVGSGEILGIVRESGCGKSITAMATLGLLPSTGTIEGGHVLFGGQDLAQLPEGDLRAIRGRQIAAISQEPMISLDPSFKVGSQLV